MCRDKDHGGRRCPNDGAVARRNRRRNAKKREEYKNEVDKRVESQTLDIEPVIVPNEIDEKAKVIINDVKATISEYRKVTPKTPERDETLKYHSEPLTVEEIRSEELVITIGNRIEELSKIYGAPTDAEWEQLQSDRADIEAEHLIIKDKQYEKINAVLGIQTDRPGSDWIVTPTGGISQRGYYRSELNRLKSMGITDESNEFIKVYNEMEVLNENKHNKLKANDAEYKKLTEKRADAYREALQSVGVEFAEKDDLKFKNVSNLSIENKLQTAATYYPKEWVSKSNETKRELEVRVKVGRANYSPSSTAITISDEDDQSTYVHELGHHMENGNIEVGQAERRFLNRRAGFVAYENKEIKKKPGITTVYAGRSEWGYSDNFSTKYVGKVYDYDNRKTARERKYMPDKGNNHYEVLTMGMESVFYGKHGGGLGAYEYKKDIEHHHFVLGIMAATASK